MPTRSVRRPAPLALALAALLGCAHAGYKPHVTAVPYDGFFATFPSGLRVVAYQIPGASRSRVTVSYGAGSADEPEGKAGLARLAAQLTWRTSPDWMAGERLWDRAIAAGYRFDAAVGRDATDFGATGAAEDLRTILRLEAARLRAPLAGVSADDLAVERDLLAGLVRERRELDPDGDGLDAAAAVLFAGAPYGRHGLVSAESLAAITLADVQAFVADRYRPENAVVVIAGPLPPRDATALVAAAFGELAEPPGGARTPPRLAPAVAVEPVAAAPAVTTREGAVSRPVLWVAWAVPGDRAQREPQAHATAAALLAALSAKLEATYGRELPAHVAGVSARVEPWAGAGLLAVRVELVRAADAEKVADLARSAAFELRGETGGAVAGAPGRVGSGLDDAARYRTNLGTEGIGAGGSKSTAPRLTGSEAAAVAGIQDREQTLSAMGNTRAAAPAGPNPLVTTRTRLLTESAFSLDALDGGRVARWLRATEDPNYVVGWERLVGTQLRQGVSGYATAFLTRERSAAVLVTSPGAARARAVLPALAVTGHDRLPEEGAGAVPAAEAALALAPPPGLDRAERRVLANGLTVVLLQRGALPIAELRLVVRTTPEGVPGAPAGLPALALAAADPDLPQHRLGVIETPGSVALSRAAVVYAARGTAAGLDDLLEATDRFAEGTDPGSFREAKTAALQEAARRDGDPGEAAARALREALFPGAPSGAAPAAAGVAAMEARTATAWLRTELRPERATLVIVTGEPPSPELWATIERHLGGWSRGAGPRAAVAPAPLPERRRVILVDRPGAKRALVAVGWRAPARRERDEAGTAAVRWVLEERLVRALQVEAGAAHGAGVEVVDDADGAALVGAASVDAGAAPQAVSVLLSSVAKLAERPLAPAEAARVRWRLAREQARRLDALAGAADALAELARQELPADALEQLPAQVAALDPARIQASAAALGAGREVVIVVGDAAALRPALERAGLQLEAP